MSIATEAAHPGEDARAPATRDVIRAIVIVAWLAALVVSAIPEHVPTTAELSEPGTRARLESLGLGSADEAARAIVDVQAAALRAKHAMLAPVAPIFETLRLRQQWTMFGNVDRVVDRLVVEILTDGGERQVLLRAGDLEHQELSGLLLDRRVRALWHVPQGGVRPELSRVVTALEPLVFARHPEAHALIVRVEAVSLDGNAPFDRFVTGRARPSDVPARPR